MARLALCLAALFAASTAEAQFGSAAAGTANGGGLQRGGSSFGNSTLGGSSFGGGAAGGFGTNTRGQAAGIDVGAGGASGINRTFGGDFIGGGDTADRFVGSQQAGPQTGTPQLPNFSVITVQPEFTPPSPPRSPVRAQLRVGFDRLGPTALGGTDPSGASLDPSRVRVSRLAQPDVPVALRRVNGAVEVEFVDGVARLGGTVATQRDRRLAEALMRLEPGVRSVESNLAVER